MKARNPERIHATLKRTRELGHTGTPCTTCTDAKVCYLNKTAAKKAATRIAGPREKTNVYKCGDYYHWGHLAESVVIGTITRTDIYKPVKHAREEPSTDWSTVERVANEIRAAKARAEQREHAAKAKTKAITAATDRWFELKQISQLMGGRSPL